MKIDKEDLPEVFDVCYVDCDLIKYRSSFAAEKTYWHLYDPDGNHIDKFESAKKADEHLEELSEFLMVDVEGYYREPDKVIGEEEQAINACDLILNHIKKNCPAKEYKLYLTGNDTYRPSVATLYKYKGNRDGMEKPKWIDSVTQHLIKEHGAKVVDYIEADDTLTVGLTNCKKKGILGVVANIDKDIKQVEGYHYNWDKNEYEYIDHWQGLLHTYAQACGGDPVDHYKGIPGIGMKKAVKMLENCQTEREMYEVSIAAYRKHFGEKYTYKSWDGKDMSKTPEELFLENMNLAFMQREKGKFYKVPKKE